MKKLLAILMALTLLITLSACGKKDAASSSEPETLQEDDGYSIALKISVNPQFTLYINKQNNVTLIDFMNDDAKSIEADISYKDTDFKSVVKSIISACKSHGFIENEATVKFEIPVSAWNDNSWVLEGAKTAAEEIASELQITLTIEGAEAETLKNESNPDENTSSSSQPTTSTQTTSNTSNSNTSNSSGHTHSFSAATCTAAPTCTCGAVNGKALGHSWTAATCKAPKTCKACGAKEGAASAHKYSNGSCSVCGDSQYQSITNISTTDNYIGNYTISGNELLGYGINIGCDINEPNLVIGNIVRMFNSEKTDPEQTPITFKGQTFYSEGEGASPCPAEIIDNRLVVTDYGDTVKFALRKDGYLVVTESDAGNFPVGMLLSKNPNDFLTK